MGLGQLRAYCLEGGQEEPQEGHIQKLTQDFSYFQEEKWFSFQNPILFDANKFIFLYPNYKEEQAPLVARWDATLNIKNIECDEGSHEEDCLSTTWKYAIKRGVPMRYYRLIISAIFSKTFTQAYLNFERAKAELKPNQSLALFGHEGQALQEVTLGPFLNDRGYDTLRDLLSLVRKKKGDNMHNKYLCHLLALFLLFFNESETYDIVSTLLQESSNLSTSRLQSMRWHLVFKEEQLKYLSTAFYSIIAGNSPTIASIVKQLNKNRVDKEQLFERVVQNFFYGYLPFSFILRIFIVFLNEGIKIFLRVFYGMLVYTEKDLVEVMTTSKACSVLKKKCLCLTSDQIQMMMKKSFNLNLKATVSPQLVEQRLQRAMVSKKHNYLPLVEGTSHILSYQDLEIIWSYLPFELKTYDLKLTYPLEQTNIQSLSLSKLLKTLEQSKFSLIVVQTMTDNHPRIFGTFIRGKVTAQQTKQWYGNKENFVFTLHPEPIQYASTRENSCYLLTGQKSLSIGGGDKGSALLLNEQLQKGQSYSSSTFLSPPLNNGLEGEFQVDCIQAFTLF